MNTSSPAIADMAITAICYLCKRRLQHFSSSKFLFFILGLFAAISSYAEGSRTLAPNYGDTVSTWLGAPSNNNELAWLEHDSQLSGDFLDPAATSDQRLFVRMLPGETLYYGLRRIPVKYDNVNPYSQATTEGNNQDLTVVIYDNAGNIVQAVFFERDATFDGQARLDASYTSSGTGTDGIITSVANSLNGPEFTYNSNTINSGGYSPLSYTNDTGSDQDFYITFIQDNYTYTSHAQFITDIENGTINDADIRSWYDLWDFSVYDNNEEKPGRLHCKRWNLTVQDLDNVLADEVKFYAQVPSVIDGVNQGNYIKQVDLGGLEAFSIIIYANSEGSDGSNGDLNGDGITDFQDDRMSTTSDIGQLDYPMFINNPDIDLYPTTVLPTVNITNANFYCNSQTQNGEASITFEANQTGQIAILVDLDGTNGYQAGTEDVIIEALISSEGYETIIWDGLDGNGNPVPSGTEITISGRFTAGPIHIPLWDVEANNQGMNMLDVRPSTSFDLIYWDDDDIASGATPEIELDGTNTSLHTWTDGDDYLVNTWSFGFYQINTENVVFQYNCNSDGDNTSVLLDQDNDNDGIPDSSEGDFNADTDGDGIPDYLDSDLAGFVDSNGDGINDNFDFDLDGIPDGRDKDSDNDGIPDVIEAGGVDADNNGIIDCGSAYTVSLTVTDDGGATTTHSGYVTVSESGSSTNFTGSTGAFTYDDENFYLEAECATVGSNFNIISEELASNEQAVQTNAGPSYDNAPTGVNDRIRFTFDIATTGTYTVYGRVSGASNVADGFWVRADGGTYVKWNNWDTGGDYDWVQFWDSDNGESLVTYNFNTTGSHTIDIAYRDDNAIIDKLYISLAGTTPTGEGSTAINCNISPESGINISSSSGTSPFTVNFTANAQDFLGGSIASYSWDFGDGNTSTSQNPTHIFDVNDAYPLDLNHNGICDAYDNTCDGTSSTFTTYAIGANTSGTVNNPTNALGAPNGDYANIATEDSYIDLQLPDLVNGGTTITINMALATGTGFNVTFFESQDGTTFSNSTQIQLDGGTTATDYTYILVDAAEYIRVRSDGNTDRYLYHISYDITTSCGPGTPLSIPDTDGDGVPNYKDLDADNDGIVDAIEAGGSAGENGYIANYTDNNGNGLNDDQEVVPLSLPDTDGDGTLADYLDIDSDNDGIPDNIEAQRSDSTIAIVAGDTNGNGLLDIYDPQIDGTLLTTVDTDGDGDADYADTDADGDGVRDQIEGWDSDFNGYGDWDATGSNNDITDETGYNTDTDGDGLWDIYDNVATTGVTNIVGSSAPLQNTDGADLKDWQDTDDDNDGSLTSGEDVNTNNNWSDDFTEGQGASATVPDYLFRGDYDGDSIADKDDTDSDNDGISDAEESNGQAYDPSQDHDNDGIPNYRDPDLAGGFTDVNGDGVFDEYDTDRDGIPDFLDLDSDNDGIWDAVEAYGGSLPNGMDQTTGQFTLNDPDNDGLMNYIDSSPAASGGSSTLSNPDSDGDGIKDYIDIDSDGDGIVDLIESQTTAALVTPSGLDSDGDGIDDAFDPNNGGVLITPVNTDGLDFPDYLDDDSDNDNVSDLIEGHDANINGFGDWDTNQSGTADEANMTTDTDGDGLADAFDTVTLGDAGNATGSNAALQNTDGLDQLDFRDTDDDADGTLTENEDSNANGNYQDDQTQGQEGGSTVPNYLFNGDYDNDNITDINDGDSDNDGIPDSAENGGQAVNPDGDEDGDGIPNYKDTDDPAVTGVLTSTADANGDGVYDVYDADGDGVPDFRDADSDNDGIPDLVEAGGTDSDGDGQVDCYDEFYLEAECHSYGGNWTTVTGDADASNGTYVEYPSGTTINNPPINNDDYLTYTFSICTAGTFDVWFLARTANGGDDSFWVAMDNDTDTTKFNNINGGTTDFAWDQLHDTDNGATTVSYTLSAGQHTLRIGYREDGAELDKIFLTRNGTTPSGNTQSTINCLSPGDTDSDGVADFLDIDSDNDGITDLTEAGGTDSDGDGRADVLTDSDNDGLADLFDTDNGGTQLAIVDSDSDGIPNYQDLDSDNDGVTDATENGGDDSNGDGLIDGYASDADGDGLADIVDPDSGGVPISGVDTDGDGIPNSRDLDSDNDGLPDIIEAGGTDGDNDGIVDDLLDIDQDGIPANVDVDETGGTDADGDGIDDQFDVTYTGGNDTDGDGIDNVYDYDKNGDGFSDFVEANPYTLLDTDGDGNKNFRDIDSDNDGIVDVIEFGETADAATGTIDGFTDTDGDGLNDTQDGYLGTVVNGAVSPITPVNSDTGTEPADAVKPDYLDIDSDNDGVVDLYESQTKATLISLSGVDSDGDGLDDAFDPNAGGSLITPVNTDGDANPDYLDDDSDGDGVNDQTEGDNANKDSYGDWDADTDGNFDDAGYNTDTDADGLLDIFDNVSSVGDNNVTGSSSAVQDTDKDGTWDFQDLDDDNDGIDTNDPADYTDFNDDPNGIIPDYLYGDTDFDDDGIANADDLDADNDGVANTAEDGGTGIDPNGDLDGDGFLNFEDTDIDGDGIANSADTDTGGINTTGFTDLNGDGTIDQFDKDLDGTPDYIDRDSDNDGIADVIEFGLTDADKDGTLDEGSGITDVNGNGLDDNRESGPLSLSSSFADECISSADPTHNLSFSVSTVDANADATLSFTLVGDYGPQAGESFTLTGEGSVNLGTYDRTDSDNPGAADCETLNFSITISQANWNTFNNDGTVSITMTTGGGVDAICSGNSSCISNTEVNWTISNPSSGSPITPPDTDSDGIEDHLDLDADADGIPDNIEAQTNADYTAPVLTDSDGDGILDVYDEDVAVGNAITPIDTDGDGNEDYIDTDSDDDNIPDVVEAWDSDLNGFGDWDSDSNNDPTDETGYASDVDADGISYIFDNVSGKGSIANISGTSATLGDTDGDGIRDFRDTDDDGDGINTDTEDNNSNLDWTDDFTQGGRTVPDYLYSPDNDGDGIINSADLDADNDGILNSDESPGVIYDALSDLDQDGTFNYLDSDLPGYTDSNGDGVDDRYDQDLDGVPNFFDLDSDDDGIPDLVEVGNSDADGDGRLDSFTDTNSDGADDNLNSPVSTLNSESGSVNNATRAEGLPDNSWAAFNNTGVVTADIITLDLGSTLSEGTIVAVKMRIRNNASSKTMTVTESNNNVLYNNDTDFTLDTHLDVSQFFYYELAADARYLRFELTARTSGNMQIDGISYNSSAPTDTDGDGLADFLDLDSDDDGITDNREGQTSAGYIAPTTTDTDGDGLKDVYDGNNGGTAIATPVDTDGDGTDDYLDTDSDDDNVLDEVEGFDANKNGYSDLDSDQDGSLTDESGYGNDIDGDGLGRLFDNYSGSGVNNTKGSKATIQDTDGDGIPDWRDDEDDSDGIDTSAEDTSDGSGGGADGNYYNDKTQGGGATPDYLYFNDIDGDGEADGIDLDSDNDGITDAQEAPGVDYGGGTGPFDDNDNDGIFNFRDSDATGFTDADGNGVDDQVDADGDGIPNFFDLDSDNDGIPDGIEGNGGTLPAGQSDNGQYPETAPDADNDGLADGADAGTVTSFPLPDTDGDGILDFLDLDSDSDGISDLLEAGGNDANGDGMLDAFGDTDGDGLGNTVDSDNGGTALPVPNTDAADGPDYIDTDSEDDGNPDFYEGFYEQAPNAHQSSYASRVSDYNATTGSGNTYSTADISPANGTPDYLDDSDGDGIPNLLDPQSAFYFDDDNDGIINLFDTDQSGQSYGAVSGQPDRDSDGTPNVLDGSDVPLPLDFLSFVASARGENVLLTWETTNEINVSHFEVEHSTDGENWSAIGVEDAVNISERINVYNFIHSSAIKGYNFYRLKEVDIDGKNAYSEIIYLVLDSQKITWSLYPNPTQDVIRIQSNVTIPSGKVQIVDMNGRIIHDQEHALGAQAVEIDLSAHGSGVYQLFIELPDDRKVFRVIKK
ncbi:T9SS type A sorting domain-containing protein [Marinoscillum furvescens]|uniref:Putative secreted protein (Por secretion system target) n=1 Tax=Marinoscillum furvescens DSM 4134 TaxID=1122208 RepID=A0A3D9KZ28_MARFU|nr:T9SS type A sorting domain-containing protein [Marinoscillum furvescens]RED93359.1 putative secreted protein (Por secretion system target) [Marinoscillum furvescens DSM 4134]